MEQKNLTELADKIAEESFHFSRISDAVNEVIVGQKNIIQDVLIAILCRGHILLEGVPGVAKTTMVKAFAHAMGLSFSRIQFTPDLLPADVIGTLIFNYKTQEFETKKGPIFANLVLADEINRAPAKVQSALLEAMQERQVTIGSNTFKLDAPFLVFATQNPIEQEGTYTLPEAQVDRFLFKLNVTYPSIQEEKSILHRSKEPEQLKSIVSKEEILRAQKLVEEVYVDDKIVDYIVNIVFATREPEKYKLAKLKPFILYGVSPRATIALNQAAKAHAFLQKRYFVTPDDVKAIAQPVLGHRLLLSYEAEAQNINAQSIVKKILETVPSP